MTSVKTQRVKNYWTVRARDFASVRKNELADPISGRWMAETEPYLPGDRSLDILDAGTGTGYFAILLAKRGHRVTGIDLTPAMLEEAAAQAAEEGVSPCFRLMDAQATEFAAESDHAKPDVDAARAHTGLPGVVPGAAAWRRAAQF